MERRWGPEAEIGDIITSLDDDRIYGKGDMPLITKPATGWKFGAVTTHPGIVLP